MTPWPQSQRGLITGLSKTIPETVVNQAIPRINEAGV